MCRPGRIQSGFTLIEVLIGITLGIVILGGVLSVFSPALVTWRAAAATSALQDVEQLAHETLSRNIRQSGLLVCGDNNNLANGVQTSGGDPISATGSVSKWAFKFTRPYQAVAATDSTNVSNLIEASGDINKLRLGQDGAVTGSASAATAVGDMFYTLVPGGEVMRIVSNNNSGTQNIVLSGASDLKEGELFLIHDCDFPVLVRAESGTSGSTIYYHSTHHTGYNYAPNTIVSRFTPILFYIGVHNNVPTLYRRTLSKSLSSGKLTHVDTPLLTGVENLRIEYGVDLPAATSGAVGANRVTDYYTVSGMETKKSSIPNIYDYALIARISIMIRTDQKQSNNSQNSLKFIALNGATVDCYSASADASACPAFLAGTRDRIHKSARFSVNLSTKHVVIN